MVATRAKTWGEFIRWCESRGLKSLPAHPWTIAAYLRWVDRRKGAQAARDALNVIAREHLLKTARVPARHPTVQSTIELIERRAETRGLHSNLFDEDAMVETESQEKPDEIVDAKPEPAEPEQRPKRRNLASTPRLVRRRTR